MNLLSKLINKNCNIFYFVQLIQPDPIIVNTGKNFSRLTEKFN